MPCRVERVCRLVRRAVRALKPLAAEGTTAAASLEAIARNFEGTGIQVSFEAEGAERELAEEAEIALYRAMQEGLANAAKHGKARRVWTTLSFSEDAVRLVVADDGEGFSALGANGDAAVRGFGLCALKERVEALGGTMVSGDRPEGGFALVVEMSRRPAEAVRP
jgi:signal transduction histidine kinase